CGGGSGSSVSPPAGPTPGPPGKRYPAIDHVVIVVQENRTVDNLFQGFPGADTRPYGFDRGRKVALQPIPLETVWDFAHDSNSFLNSCDGTGSYPGSNCKMDGFGKEFWHCGKPHDPPCPNSDPPYSYVPRSETQP